MKALCADEPVLVLLCEDSAEGIFTGVYEAYALKRSHESIRLRTGGETQTSLFTEYREIATDEEKARRVMKTLKGSFCAEDYEAFFMAAASPVPEKAQAIYGSIVWGLAHRGRGSILRHLTDPDVCRMLELARNASNELHHLKGFLRFQELESGLLFSVIQPKNAVLAMLAEHFADRLPSENFLIYDEGRKQYAIHPAGRSWFLSREQEEVPEPAVSAQEEYYGELFWRFCHSISIDERKNIELQRNLLPLRFRPYMTEFKKSNEK